MDEYIFFGSNCPVWDPSRSRKLVPCRFFKQISPDGHLINECSSQKLAENFNLEIIRINGTSVKPQDTGRHA